MTLNETTDIASETGDLLRSIEPARCWQLLEAVQYGRLATVENGHPLLVVVNHVVDDGDICIRTGSEARLAKLTENGQTAAAVYEADSAFPAAGSGWSVMATGVLRRERGEARSAQLLRRLAAWAQGDRDVVLLLEVRELTGRVVGRP